MIFRQDSKIANLFLKANEAEVDYPKTTTSAIHTLFAESDELDPGDTDVDKPVLILVEVTEAFANGNGTQPTFTIGQTGSATKFSVAGLLTDAAKNSRFLIAGTWTNDTDLIVTAVVATGTTSTGAIRVTAVALPPR